MEFVKKNVFWIIVAAVLIVFIVQGLNFETGTSPVEGYEPSEMCLEIVEHEELDESLDCYCESPELFDIDDVEPQVAEVTYVEDVLVCESDYFDDDLIYPLRIINEDALEDSELNESDIEESVEGLEGEGIDGIAE